MAFTAIEMLAEAGLLQREIVLLLNTDEELGSTIHGHHRAAGCCERGGVCAGAGTGAGLQDCAQGTGDWRIEIKGVAAHAGVDFEKGASAILELARVIEAVSGWTDLKRGLTVSVGLIGGGSKTNVIPAEAWRRWMGGLCARRTAGGWSASSPR